METLSILAAFVVVGIIASATALESDALELSTPPEVTGSGIEFSLSQSQSQTDVVQTSGLGNSSTSSSPMSENVRSLYAWQSSSSATLTINTGPSTYLGLKNGTENSSPASTDLLTEMESTLTSTSLLTLSEVTPAFKMSSSITTSGLLDTPSKLVSLSSSVATVTTTPPTTRVSTETDSSPLSQLTTTSTTQGGIFTNLATANPFITTSSKVIFPIAEQDLTTLARTSLAIDSQITSTTGLSSTPDVGKFNKFQLYLLNVDINKFNRSRFENAFNNFWFEVCSRKPADCGIPSSEESFNINQHSQKKISPLTMKTTLYRILPLREADSTSIFIEFSVFFQNHLLEANKIRNILLKKNTVDLFHETTELSFTINSENSSFDRKFLRENVIYVLLTLLALILLAVIFLLVFRKQKKKTNIYRRFETNELDMALNTTERLITPVPNESDEELEESRFISMKRTV